MNLIELILFCTKSFADGLKKRQIIDELKGMGVSKSLRCAILACFNENGTPVDSDGNPTHFELVWGGEAEFDNWGQGEYRFNPKQ